MKAYVLQCFLRASDTLSSLHLELPQPLVFPTIFPPSRRELTYPLQVTILEGTATWCAQCKVIAPEVAKMVDEYPNVKFYLYDVEECEDVAQELGVRSMPTFSIFKDGDIQVCASSFNLEDLENG